MVIDRTIEIDYGHTLPNHFSFCNQIHGHRGVITAYVKGEPIKDPGSSSQGMVLDFKILKELMMSEIHAVLDHGFAIWEEDTKAIIISGDLRLSTYDFIDARNDKILVTEEPPTAEHLAEWAFNQLEEKLKEHNVKLVAVCWQETPNSKATYSPSGNIYSH